MKMKNYLTIYPSNIDDHGISVAVSHREIMRLRDVILSDQLPYKILNFSTSDHDDLYAHTISGTRHFSIVKK